MISEFETTQIQENVINSLSNIENLMINKLANTSQKLNVLKSSDKEDVLNFLKQTGGTSRGRNSKSKLKTKLRNVHSINAEAMSN